MIEQMQQYVRASSQLRLITLHSLDPTHKKQKSEHAIRTASFWTSRGFQKLQTDVCLHLVTHELAPERLYGDKVQSRTYLPRPRPLTPRDFNNRLDVPQPGWD